MNAQTTQIPVSSILCMLAVMLVSLALPVLVLLYLRRKKGCAMVPFWVGCAVFLLFVLVLERIVHALVLGSNAGTALRENLFLYALYGGAMAGIFEETGRLLAFSTVLKRFRGRDGNALMYGAGHGGMEVWLVFSATMLGNLVLALLLNSGAAGALLGSLEGLDAAARGQLDAGLATLAETPGWMYFMGLLERVIAMAIHMSLSVPVWFAVKNRRWGLYPLAIVLHLIVDGLAIVLPDTGLPVPAVEGILAVAAALLVLVARWIWKRNAAGEDEPA